VLTWALCESRRATAARSAHASDNATGRNNNQRKATA
jgi:cytochrome c oxidase assembly protein subunit 15